MASFRSVPLTLVICFCAITARLSGSGGWYDREAEVSTLGQDLDRLPEKTLGQILLETAKQDKLEIAEITDKDAVSNAEISAVIDRIGKEKPSMLAAEIDKLVVQARQHYVLGGGVLNVLYDVRDAITVPGATTEQRRDYCKERLRAFSFTEIDLVDNPMQANQMCRRGAKAFRDGAYSDAWGRYKEVLEKYPDHPRAETALFMSARCAHSLALIYDPGTLGKDVVQKSFEEAEVLYWKYLKKYPKGRYVADVHGWLGGLLWSNHPSEALEEFITQLEDPAHPECRKSASHMVESVLATVVGHPKENEAVFKVVARHPRVAQAAVYLVLNAAEIDPDDGKYDSAADLKKWKLQVLPKLAAAVSKEEALYKGDWALRMRAMLAQAASGVGHQEEALKLTNLPENALEKSDDLLFARILVLQRMGKHQEAIRMGRLFFDHFEKSQLSKGVALRLAQSLIDDHHAGEAYVILSKTSDADRKSYRLRDDEGNYPPAESELGLTESAIHSGYDGGDAFAVLKYTILNFAPLPELEAVLQDKTWDAKPDALKALNKVLRIRKAAQEDFAGAARLGGDDAFKQQMKNFAMLVEKVNGASGEARARAMMELGDAFDQAQDESSSKTEAVEDRDFDPAEWQDDLVRRDNARAVGFAHPDEELESRNLMRHATQWWLRAARTAPSSAISAQARLRALGGIEIVAKGSDYDFTRAMETNMAQASREIYDSLQKENPKSEEARQAAYWSFEPSPKPKVPWDPKDDQPAWSVRGQFDPEREEDALSLLGGYHALPYDAFGKFPLANDSDDSPDGSYSIFGLTKEISGKADKPEELQTEFTAAMVAENFKNLRDSALYPESMYVRNLFEDLTLFYQVPGLSDQALHDYIQLRLRADEFPWFNPYAGKPDPRPTLESLLKQARANPDLAKAQDFVDYVEIYGQQSSRGRGAVGIDYPAYDKLEEACRAFLKKYPDSPRRQACSLVLIRSLFRQLPDRFGHEGPGARHEHSSEDSRPVVELDAPFQPEALEKAIADYEKEFPKPRYAAEMRNYKGIVAWRKFDYGLALELTIAQLDDMDHPDLRREAAVRQANIFADLRDAEHRTAVLAALKTRPAALARLKLYLDIAPQHAGHPLRCMRKYLGDQLGFQ